MPTKFVVSISKIEKVGYLLKLEHRFFDVYLQLGVNSKAEGAMTFDIHSWIFLHSVKPG